MYADIEGLVKKSYTISLNVNSLVTRRCGMHHIYQPPKEIPESEWSKARHFWPVAVVGMCFSRSSC